MEPLYNFFLRSLVVPNPIFDVQIYNMIWGWDAQKLLSKNLNLNTLFHKRAYDMV